MLERITTKWLPEAPRTSDPVKFLIAVSKPYGKWVFLAFIGTIVSSAVNIATPYAFKLIVDATHAYTTYGDASALWRSAWLFIGTSFTTVVLWRAGGYGIMFWATGARSTARETLTTYLAGHSYEYFSNRFVGSLSGKISNASKGMRDMIIQIVREFTGFLVTILTSFAVAFYTNPLIAFIFLGWVFVVVPFNLYFAKKRIGLSVAAEKADNKLNGVTSDVIGNVIAVHEYARSTDEAKRLRTMGHERRIIGLRNWLFGDHIQLINAFLQSFFIGALALTSIHFALTNTITFGDLALILTIIYFVEGRIAYIGNGISQFAELWGTVKENLQEILVPHDIHEASGATNLEITYGSIKFENVVFDYGGKKVFSDFSLSIPKGQRVGLVGRSGAGKPTLMKLLLRHYDVNSGVISIDRQNIQKVTKDSLRKVVAVVPQEPMLFHRSIRENIAYGRPEATIAEVIEAAKAAQAHDFIEGLAGGYDSLVGERGVKLSGGQRQRVVLARAILKDAPILLLDEATSSLDSESEAAFQQALYRLMEGRTVVAIAHRLSTLRAMDRIVVMDEGEIVEDGSHDELIAKGGLYADLWNHQAGGFITE